MKCQIQWIDERGRPTPDQNEAVGVAIAHKSIWLSETGCEHNRIVGYSQEIKNVFPICADHLSQVRGRGLDQTVKGGGWQFFDFRPAAER